jgi:hypothetical protein
LADQVRNLRFVFQIDSAPLQQANAAGTNLNATLTHGKTLVDQFGRSISSSMSTASSAITSTVPPVRVLQSALQEVGTSLTKIPPAANAANEAMANAAKSNTFQWRLLEQEIGTRVPMALNRVLTQSQAMSSIMTKIFPLAMAGGFAMVVGEIAVKFLEWATNQKAVIAGIEQIGASLERAQERTKRSLTASQTASDQYLGLTQGPGAEQSAKMARLQQEVTAAAYKYDQMRRGTAALQTAPRSGESINPIGASLGLALGILPPGQGRGAYAGNGPEVVISRDQKITLAQQYENEARADLDNKTRELARMQAEASQRISAQGLSVTRETAGYSQFISGLTRKEEPGPYAAFRSEFQRGLQEQTLKRQEELSKPGGATGIPGGYQGEALAAYHRSVIFMGQEEAKKAAAADITQGQRFFVQGNALDFRETMRTKDRDLEQEQKDDEERLRVSDRIGEIQGRGSTDMLRREFQRSSSLVAGSGGDAGAKANQQYALRIQLANQINSIEVSTASQIANDGQRAIQLEQAKYQLIAEGDQARLDREVEFQKIQEKQLQETAQFAAGLTNAGLQGGRAPVRFMENYAHQIISTVAGNAGKMFLGPMEGIFSLGKSGILGAPGAPNPVGQLLQGTIFGVNPMDQAQGQMVYYLSDIAGNMRITAAALSGRSAGGGGANPSGAGAGGVATGLLADSTAILRDIRPGVGGGLVIGGHTFPSLAALIQHAWGGRGAGDPITPIANSDQAIMEAAGNPYAGSAIGSDGLPLPSTAPLMPLITSSWSGTANAMGGAIWAGAYSAIGALSRGSWNNPSAARMLGISGTSLSMIGGGVAGKGTAQEISAGGGWDVLTGKTGWTPTGQIDPTSGNPVYSQSNLSTSQMVGGYISLAGTEISGISSAVSGFSKGGASGDLQGIAGIATAVAPFTGPAAPFIMAGAAMMSLISTLFTTGPQQRQLNEQRTILNNSYVRLSPRQYNFSADGAGGFALDAYGGAISGAPNTVYPLQPGLQDMTAQQFRQFAGSNPTAWSAGTAAALSSGGDSELGSLMNFIVQYGGN